MFLPGCFSQSFYVYAGTYGGQHFCQLDTLYIVSLIKNAIKRGYRRILFDNMYEAVYFDIIRKIHRIIRMIDDPSVEYVYLSAAQNSKDAYKNYCIENNISPVLKLENISLFEYSQKNSLVAYLNQNSLSNVEYEVKEKSKLFCCFNKMVREHRVRIFANILKNNWLDKTYSSFQYGKETIKQLAYASRIDLLSIFNQYKEIFPLTLNMSDTRQNPVDVQEGDFIYHKDSYFSLVTETLFFKNQFDAGDSVFLTEKTFRPIIHKHPFILVAPAGSLSYLKKRGYKTFSPFINESYDNIIDDELRFNAIWEEVERLSKFSSSEWLEWQKAVADIVEHNYCVIMNKNIYTME